MFFYLIFVYFIYFIYNYNRSNFSIKSRIARKTKPNTENETEEHAIEKILAKRYNPPRKVYEYLVKWENIPHDQNTWEPQINLTSCPQLLENFEKQLTKQKEQRAAMAAKQQLTQSKPVGGPISNTIASTGNITTVTTPTNTYVVNKLQSPPRPARFSKAKAMDQVKQWCADNEEENNTNKRKLVESDYENESEDDEHSNLTIPEKKLRMSVSPPSAPSPPVQKIIPPTTRILQVNNSKPVNTVQTKLNGTTNTKVPPGRSADIVIKTEKDGQQTGIVKKPGAAITSV